MQPEAWNLEHNRLHHYRLNELEDPDLVQRNTGFLREDEGLSMVAKYATVAAFFPIWKWYYYAPNTYKELKAAEYLKANGGTYPDGFDKQEALSLRGLLAPKTDSERAVRQIFSPVEFMSKVLAPFFLGRFVLLPMPLLAVPGIGPTLYGHAVVNLIAADLLSNIHAFCTIVTNHAGEDMYTFNDAVRPKSSSFYVRQIIGSANYATGTDLIDFSHGWLNYQIEHHVWPDLSMKQYQTAAPRLKEICHRYGVPYVQESVFERLRKTVDIMVGKTTMRVFPTEYEPVGDKAKGGTVSWKATNGAIDDDE